MDKKKALRYIAIQLNSIEADLQDILAELDFTEKEYSEMNKNVCNPIKKAINYLNSIN